jgi:hypothetical protein
VHVSADTRMAISIKLKASIEDLSCRQVLARLGQVNPPLILRLPGWKTSVGSKPNG